MTDFSKLWDGGYFEGVPTDPMGKSSYGNFGYTSSLYTTYVGCIKPYVGPGTTALEIGPGRGAWSKAIADCNPNHLYVVDAASATHTGFWEYVGKRPNVEFFQVENCDLEPIPDASIDFFFSFGVFCHLRPEMSIAYINALGRKMKPGSNGFLMVADFAKYHACHDEPYRTSVLSVLDRRGGRRWALAKTVMDWIMPKEFLAPNPLNINGPDGDGAWFDLGVDKAVAALQAAGFVVVDRDMQVNNRDPVIHFTKY